MATEQTTTANTKGPYGDRLTFDLGNLPTGRIMPLNQDQYFLAAIVLELKDISSKLDAILKPDVEFIEDGN